MDEKCVIYLDGKSNQVFARSGAGEAPLSEPKGIAIGPSIKKGLLAFQKKKKRAPRNEVNSLGNEILHFHSQKKLRNEIHVYLRPNEKEKGRADVLRSRQC